ncbi:hypothetical protein SGGBAA2069_c06620 [Streptococcus gallolyticus subsp. gallolyticus ATCC BAA-2069]|nr:hypothetical protein SGGBAA2069_c06620 [Streptococcus gallolyticus subsp. gallolyticus ATCC BAA-2069]
MEKDLARLAYFMEKNNLKHLNTISEIPVVWLAFLITFRRI